MTLALSRWLVLVGYFGMIFLLLNWFSWLSPPGEIPRALLLIALLIPLMFPMRGILRGQPYTHQWSSFLALLYFAIGVDVAFTYQHLRWYGLALTLLSLLFFIGCVYFAKLRLAASQNQNS